jgi:hypothetical protein
MTGWARILERVSRPEIGARGLAYLKEGRNEEPLITTGKARQRRDALILSRPPALVKAAAPATEASAVSGPAGRPPSL